MYNANPWRKGPKGLFAGGKEKTKDEYRCDAVVNGRGLGLFLFGMRLMSESIEKAAGAKLRGILEMFTKNRFVGMLVGIIFYSGYTVLLGVYGNGSQLRQLGADESVSGGGCNLWCQYRYYGDLPACFL